MYITKTLDITRKAATGNFIVKRPGLADMVMLPGDAGYEDVENFYRNLTFTAQSERERLVESGELTIPAVLSSDIPTVTAEPSEPAPAPEPKEILLRGLSNMINFFSEFAFTPSFRFVNTLALHYNTPKTASDFISNYFHLMDSAYTNDVVEKMKSPEFKDIIKDIAQYGTPSTTVNSRLKVYYGPAGTGKTTQAQQETENRCIVCNSSMLPSDLMEDFMFDSGNPTFNPSVLCECMEKGLPIVLDEINLLPFDSLRFLQGITDGKSSIIYKNRTINIHEGFQIIGTMNLSLGGATYGLPEPLVDRCSEIKSFTLTAEQLAAAIM